MIPKWIIGETVGTFLLIFFGCGAVAGAVAFNAFQGVFQVASVWGFGLTIAILLTRNHSQAHFNPAITLPMYLFKGMPGRLACGYVFFQMLGAFVAACALFLIFREPLSAHEKSLGIQRGQHGSEATAMVFGEYFPNPGGNPLTSEEESRLSTSSAFFAELIGTGLLAFAVFGLTSEMVEKRLGDAVPFLIGITLTILICIFGPVTMACFNPARDFAPRLFSALAGWGGLPFRVNGQGWWIVYIAAPLCGGVMGAWLATRMFRKQD